MRTCTQLSQLPSAKLNPLPSAKSRSFLGALIGQPIDQLTGMKVIGRIQRNENTIGMIPCKF